jgi:uncharacterized membrane protein YphA (DoxX/SURF4 family)
MIGGFMDSSAIMPLLTIPRPVIWSYLVFGVVLVVGLIAISVRGGWQKAQGFDKLLLLAPLFYAAPVAAFGAEHFTVTSGIASIIPAWIPWHLFWVYLVGACFIAGALSVVTGIQARLSASLLAMTFFLFVALMHFPAWMRHPENRFAITFVLREISFSGGALALAVSLSDNRDRRTQIAATVARYFICVPVLFFSFEQFMHADHVPGIPLEMTTPAWIWGHAIWTYLVAAVYAVAGAMLLVGKKTRTAAMAIGCAVLFVELVVYLPIAVVGRSSLESFNYMADTLMFCGSVLLLAGAMPRKSAAQGAPPRMGGQ